MIINYELGRVLAHERQTDLLRAAQASRQIHGAAGRPRRRRAVLPIRLGHVRGLVTQFLGAAYQRPAT